MQMMKKKTKFHSSSFLELKREFDLLKTYNAKLLFWKRNNFHILQQTAISEGISISIQPKDAQEEALYKKFVLSFYIENDERCNPKILKEKYNENLLLAVSDKELVQKSIQKINNEIQKGEEFPRGIFAPFLAGYKYGRIGKSFDYNNFTVSEIFDIARGIGSAKHLLFLQGEQTKLENRKEEEPIKPPSFSVEYDGTEIGLIISFLQNHRNFLQRNPVTDTQTQMERAIEKMINVNSLKKGFQKARTVIFNKDLKSTSIQEARTRINQLSKIRNFFDGIGHKRIMNEIDKLIIDIQRIVPNSVI